jgi:predicted RNase H-like nuclease (RuvC/YqgF family)
MENEMTEQLLATAERLATAAEALDRVLGRIDAQQDALNTKVDRIVAAVEDQQTFKRENDDADASHLRSRISELEKCNDDLKAQSARMARKTLPPLVTALLSKSGDGGDHLDTGALDKTLQALSVEQRIAVKSEMARAGMIK